MEEQKGGVEEVDFLLKAQETLNSSLGLWAGGMASRQQGS